MIDMNNKTTVRFFTRIQFLTLLCIFCIAVADGASAFAQQTLTPQRKYAFNHERADLRPVVTALTLSKDKSTIYVAGDDQNVYSCDVNADYFELAFDDSQGRRDGDDWIRALAFSPTTGSNLLASLTQDGQVAIWNVDTRRKVQQTTFQNRDEVQGAHSMAFLADGRMIAVSAFKSYVYVYDCNTLQRYAIWDAPGANTTEVVASPNGRLLAMGGRAGIMRLCHVKTPTLYSEIQLTDVNGVRARRIRAIAFSPSGKYVAIGGDANQIIVCEVGVGEDGTVSISQPIASLTGINVLGKVYSLTFCGENSLAAGYSTNHVRVWDVLGERVKYLSNDSHTGTVSTMCYDEDNQMLYTGSFDTMVHQYFVPKTSD